MPSLGKADQLRKRATKQTETVNNTNNGTTNNAHHILGKNKNIQRFRNLEETRVITTTRSDETRADTQSLKGSNVENPLHQFTTYNSLFTLSGVSEKELFDHSFMKNPVHDIIARSGGIGNPVVSGYRGEDEDAGENNPIFQDKIKPFLKEKWQKDHAESIRILEQGKDIFFENVNILSTASPNPERGMGSFTRMEFELHEPFGVSFVEKVRAATAINRFQDYQDAPLLLTIEWKGFDEHGRDITPKFKRETLVRKIPIIISRVEFNVNAGGATYRIIAVPYTDLAYDDRYKFPRSAMPIESDDAFTWCKSAIRILNNQMLQEIKEKKRELKDVYEFIISSEVEHGAIKYKKDVDGKASTVLSAGEVKIYTYDETSDAKMSVKISGQKTTGTDGTSLPKLFEDIIRNSFGYQNLIEDFWATYVSSGGGGDIETLTKNDNEELKKKMQNEAYMNALFSNNQYVNWFKIKTSVQTYTNENPDKYTKMHRKKITFYAQPYKIHIGKLVTSGLSLPGDFTDNVVKHYNYIYTGENIDIQNLNIFYKSAYYMRSLRGDTETEGAIKKAWNWITNTPTKVFGQDPAGALLGTRSYPSIIKSRSSVSSTEKGNTRAQEFYDYLTNPEADMMKIELEILGDPTYVAQDLYTPIHAQNIVNDGSGFNGNFNYQWHCFNVDNNTPAINLIYWLPEDINESTGVLSGVGDKVKRNMKNLFFSGVYEVVRIDSSFNQGEFKQTLTCVRLQGQNGEGLPAALTEGVTKSSKKIDSNKEKDKDNVNKKHKLDIDWTNPSEINQFDTTISNKRFP